MSGLTPPVPAYMQVIARLKQRIEKGELRPGDLLPSDRELAETYGIARATAQKAVGALRAEGLAETVPGRGTRILDRPAPLCQGKERLARARRTGSLWRPGETTSGHQAEIVPAPDDVARALDVEPGNPVIRRSRVFSDRTGIVAHSTSWIKEAVAESVPEVLAADRMPRLWQELYEERTGHRIVSRQDEVEARIATEDDLRMLGVESEETAAILVLTARFVSDEGPIEYGVDLGAPGRTLAGPEYEVAD